MSHFKFEHIDHLSSEIEAMLHQGHIKDEVEAGIVCSYKKFSIIAKDVVSKITGVLIAYTAFAEVYVDDIWITPSLRNKGLGRQLLNELENRFKGKGYNNINLVTSGFQAPEFYKKCGFEVEFIRVNSHHPKLTKTFFIKYFDDKIQTQGIL